MKTRGWILTVICSMLLLVAGITFASMVLVGQPALANESLWWWLSLIHIWQCRKYSYAIFYGEFAKVEKSFQTEDSYK